MGSAEDAAILRAFYAEHQPQFASDAEVKRICTALRRAAQKKGLLEHRHISDFIFETVAAKNGGTDPRKWFASRQRRWGSSRPRAGWLPAHSSECTKIGRNSSYS